jgi:UDPglucose 6-dehydrogenase
MARLGVIGAGYVGTISAVGFAELGHDVVLTERDPDRVAAISAGHPPLHEPGLAEALQAVLANGRLRVSSDNADALGGAAILLALPTPPAPDGRADTSLVEAVLDELGPRLTGEVVVVRSTVPLGATRQFEAALAGMGPGASVVSNPEFLREGRALADFRAPDRVVVGADDPEAAKVVVGLYDGLPGERVLTDPLSSELIKYASNSYLAARITFVNGLANLAGSVGADIDVVTHGMGLDKRIGPEFLRPGPGYGGSCFPKDILALITRSRDAGYSFDLLEAVVDADERQREGILDRLDLAVNGLDDRRIALWGLAFKAGTGDTRVSPAVKLARMLIDRGAEVVAHDPVAVPPPDLDVLVAADPVAAAEGAAAVLVATEWPEFADVDMGAVAAAMADDVVFDARNRLDPERVRAAGLRYLSLGRP